MVLNKIFAGTDLTYKMLENNLIVVLSATQVLGYPGHRKSDRREWRATLWCFRHAERIDKRYTDGFRRKLYDYRSR